mgnify:CR=1 FL=1
MRIINRIIVSTWLLISSASATHALTIGVESTNYEPYYYLTAEQKYQGAARDIFDLFAQVNQIKLDYSPMPVPRLFNEFAKGNIELKFPDNPLWSESLKADVKVLYSDPIFNITEALLVLKQSKPEVAKENIKTVGTILGFTVPGISSAIENNEFEATNTKKIEQLIHMLVSERVQAVYFNKSVAKKLIKKMYPNESLVRHSKFPAFKYAYHLSTIKHPKLIKAFNDFLVSHAEQVTKIKRRYGLK